MECARPLTASFGVCFGPFFGPEGAAKTKTSKMLNSQHLSSENYVFEAKWGQFRFEIGQKRGERGEKNNKIKTESKKEPPEAQKNCPTTSQGGPGEKRRPLIARGGGAVVLATHLDALAGP